MERHGYWSFIIREFSFDTGAASEPILPANT